MVEVADVVALVVPLGEEGINQGGKVRGVERIPTMTSSGMECEECGLGGANFDDEIDNIPF